MPIYEYECGRCGRRFEQLLKTVREAPSPCPACGSRTLTKTLSAFSVTASRPAPPACAAPAGACAGCSGGSCPYAGH